MGSGDGLYHSRYVDGVWQTEVAADDPGAGHQAALAIDASDGLHAVYYDLNPADPGGRAEIRYARQTDGGWAVEVIDDVGDLESMVPPAVAVNPLSGRHIAYVDAGDLVYARREAGEWLATRVETSGTVTGVSLALDGADRPALAYWRDDVLRYATLTADGWERESVESYANAASGLPSAAVSLAMGPEGWPHIAYQVRRDRYDTMLRYAWHDGSEWHSELIDSSSDHYLNAVGLGASLALDSSGRPHVSYSYFVESDLPYPSHTWYSLYYAVPVNGQWTALRLGRDGRHSSLVIDGSDRPTLVYLAGMTVSHLQTEGSAWQEAIVAEGGDPGAQASLQSDASGTLHIAYRDHASEVLFYGRYTEGGWEIQRIAGKPWQVPKDIGFAVSRDGNPHFVYAHYERFCPDWNYAYLDAGGFHRFPLSFSSGPWQGGEYVDITVDGDGRIHLASSAPEVDVVYAVIDERTPIGECWGGPEMTPKSEQLPSSAQGAVEVEADSAGNPHIVYHVTEDWLAYAVKGAEGWQHETFKAGASGVMGDAYLSLDVDGQRMPHIAAAGLYADLVYARRDGSGWQREYVPGFDYRDVSLALDIWGRPHMSVYEAGDGDLVYLTHNGSGWTGETLMATGDTGQLPSMLVDGPDLHIAFYDATRHDLLLLSRRLEPADIFYLPVVAR